MPQVIMEALGLGLILNKNSILEKQLKDQVLM